MRLYVQWSTKAPSDWVAVDSALWASTPSKPEPRDSDAVDMSPGWIAGLCVQGNVFHADHISVKDLGVAGVRVYAWNDDPKDWPGKRHGRVITLPRLRPDPRFDGAYNTAGTVELFAEGGVMTRAQGFGLPVKPFRRFPDVGALEVRHGIWMPDPLYAAHLAARSVRSWREWTEGVPASEIENGRVKARRSLS